MLKMSKNKKKLYAVIIVLTVSCASLPEDGPFSDTFDNGKTVEGYYKNGKPEGKWVYKDKNNQILLEGEYKNGKKTGKWKEHGKYWKESPNKSLRYEVRSRKRFGVFLGIYDYPLPSILGLNFAYNIKPYLRWTLGYGMGRLSKGASSVGTSLNFIFKGKYINPIIGLGYSRYIAGEDSIRDVSKTANIISASASAEYQVSNGLNMGLGLNTPLNAKPNVVGVFFRVGYYFD